MFDNFFKIGDFIDGQLSDITANVKDYTASGDESIWPDVRKAQCPVGKKCEECIPIATLHEGHIFESGDAYVIGLNSIFESSGDSGCGNVFTTNTYQTVEATRFAISQVNSNTAEFQSMFPKLKVGFIGISSCNNGAVIQRKIYDLFQNGLLLQNGTRIVVKDKIIGFVGDIGSSISIAAADALSRLKHVQISYASTSPLLSDRERFPYFMRVVTPDNYQAKAMVTVMKKLNATYVHLVYSKGAYGEGGRDKVLEEAKVKNICVLPPIEITDDTMNSVYGKLKNHPEATLVIVFVRSHTTLSLIAQLSQQMSPGEFQFLGSEAWAKNGVILENDNNKITLGSLTIVLELYQDKALKNHILQMDQLPFLSNPWVTLYLQEKRSCYFEMSFDKTKEEMCDADNQLGVSSEFKLDGWATSAYISTMSLLHGANNHLNNQCGLQSTVLCNQFSTDINGRQHKMRTHNYYSFKYLYLNQCSIIKYITYLYDINESALDKRHENSPGRHPNKL